MPYLSDFQAIFFDIDRTLIPVSGEIYPETIKIISSLNKRGIMIGMSSGRGYAHIVNKLIPIFPTNSIHVLSGGSFLIDNQGEALWKETIDPVVVTELKQLITETKKAAIFMKQKTLYAQDEVFDNLKKHAWKPIVKELNKMTADGVGLVYIAKANKKIKSYLENQTKLNYKYMINNRGNPYFDITAKGVNKSVAIKQWSKITKIPTSKIIGFGDSVNDLEFLQICGFSVAMGNADPEIKAIANKTIGDVDEKSLPNYIQNILKGNPL